MIIQDKIIDLDKSQQISCTVPGDIWLAIHNMSEKERRSLSQMASLLLEQAVKDKTRNRKGAKKGNAEHNAG